MKRVRLSDDADAYVEGNDMWWLGGRDDQQPEGLIPEFTKCRHGWILWWACGGRARTSVQSGAAWVHHRGEALAVSRTLLSGFFLSYLSFFIYSLNKFLWFLIGWCWLRWNRARSLLVRSMRRQYAKPRLRKLHTTWVGLWWLFPKWIHAHLIDVSWYRTVGRDRSRPLRKDWEEVKERVMEEAVRAKFQQNEEARNKLLSTGHATLIQRTRNDAYWGIPESAREGQNRMGILLMQVRQELQTS